ncbi:FAD-binding protein [Pseudomonas hefeiensis]|uniref:FAD-binding oxidoreductase n=1 Tax=Pseudomonas hefeiensis TaxID=2738125 RepID=UPI0027337381|nr:FAD-binding protein [Pseudomonas sp. FP53]WLH97869.1 FAD-binding protein [Pseudomonas sp. FP53]
MKTVPQSVNTSLLDSLTSIVGSKYATVDEGAMASYAWNSGVGSMPGPKFVSTWPVAVVWPRTTEEVASIVKFCAVSNLKFAAHSTGTGAVYLSRDAKTVVLDLSRMDDLQIDPMSQTAIIQPGITAGRLQAEAMKHGLTCHVVGAGPSHSPLASATSFHGIGITGASTGNNSRNMLGYRVGFS